MHIGNGIPDKYYTPYKTNTNVKAISGFSLNTDGKVEVKEAEESWQGFAEFVDYQEFHKQWMFQGATTAFSYTDNKGLDKENNSISLVSGMVTHLSNGFKLSINEYMVQAIGDFRDNESAKESTSIASAMTSLIKVANGQIPLNMFHSSRTQDNSAYARKGLEAFGIDTSKTFLVNEKKFYFDSEGKIKLGDKK